ncbi:MAG TPA: four helix bundle protein [Candidatus Saccharimonadales bacterium]
MPENKIVKFTDLEAWRVAHQFRIAILKLTATFPPEHRFGLSSQMQRAAISIGSNIAEGFGRQGKQEKIQFYRIARGSLTEVQDQLIVARDINLLKSDKFLRLGEQSARAHQLLNGLIRSVRTRTTKSELQIPKTELHE